MSSFERTILNTHRSKFSQYLVFYMCYKYPEPCVRLFAEFLITRLQVRLGHSLGLQHIGVHAKPCTPTLHATRTM